MKTIILSIVLAVIAVSASARECDVMVAVVPPEIGDQVPAAVASKLEAKLAAILSTNGVVASPDDSRFFFTGRFDKSFSERTSGPDQREAITTTLTLFIGDADGKRIFASKSFELKGIGKSEEQALIKAMTSINVKRPDIVLFVDEGIDKIIDYFNNNYQTFITKAQTAMNQRSYDEAFYYALQIPECCLGYSQAQSLALDIYNHQIDYIGQQLLAQAKGAFGSDPTAKGASRAFEFISQIDPSASCYAQAIQYADTMQNTVKNQWEFENIQKYKDELALKHKKLDNQAAIEKARIESARALGIAWAKAQPATRIYYRWY